MGRIGSLEKIDRIIFRILHNLHVFFAYHHSFVAINWGGTDPERSDGKC